MKTQLLLLFMIVASFHCCHASWLPREVAEVRGYVYDYTQDKKSMSLLKGGKLHKGVINTGGTKLSKDQVLRLKKSLHSKKKREPGAFCYYPHHGFVFYDKEGKAMGHIELCFQCGNVASSPKGLPEVEWDWKEIRKILTELKLPILKDNKAYTKLFEDKK